MLAISVYVGEKNFSYLNITNASVTELMSAAKTLHPEWTSLIITLTNGRKENANSRTTTES